MASLEQWTEWREEYYAGLRQIIDDAPYGIAKLIVESEGDHFVLDVAKAFVDKAIKEGFIKESEPLSFLKMCYFAVVGLVAYQNKEDVSVQDVEASCHEPDYPYREITLADDYISYALMVFQLPLLKACRYVFSNHPRACKNVILDLFKQSGEEIDFSYFRLRKEELFNYFRSITQFCLHNMLADINCPYAEEVFDAVQDGDYEFFKTLCYDKNIDFTELSEIVGYLQSGLIGSINDIEEIFESDENPDEETGEKFYSRLKNVTSMAGLPHLIKDDYQAEATILKQDIVGQLLPFIQAEEDASIISAIAFDVASMYSFIERMDDGELKEINRLLDHPDFEALVMLAQGLFCGRYDRFPNNVTIHFSQEEQNEMLSGIQADKNVKQGDAGRTNVEGDGRKPQPMVTDELHWPTDEELKGYKDNYNGKEYFTNTIFGPAGKVKASVIKELYRVLSGESILKEDIETQLIFLARYTGKEIPGLTLRPIEWHMLDSDGDGAIGYLIYMTTTKHEFVKGERFFYFDYNGVKKTPDSRQIGQIGSRWAQRPEKSTARTRFETALNKFLQEYQSSSEE